MVLFGTDFEIVCWFGMKCLASCGISSLGPIEPTHFRASGYGKSITSLHPGDSIMLPVTTIEVLETLDPEICEIARLDVEDALAKKSLLRKIPPRQHVTPEQVKTKRFLTLLKGRVQRLHTYAKEDLANYNNLAPEQIPDQQVGRVVPWYGPEMAKLQSSMVIAYMAYYNFTLSGSKVFYVVDDLADTFSVTDVDVSSEDIVLPFQTSLFVFTSAHIRRLFLSGTGKTKLSSSPISVIATRGKHPYIKGCDVLSLICSQASRAEMGGMIKRNLILRPGTSIEDAIKTDWKKEHQAAGVSRQSDDIFNTVESDKIFYEEAFDFFRVVVNSILYTSGEDVLKARCESPHADLEARLAKVKKSKKKSVLRKELNKSSKFEYICLGHGYQGNQDLIEYIRTGKSGRKLEKQVLVRGHYRWQKWGPGRQFVKRIRIEPFLKGPDVGIVSNKPYIVVGPRTVDA